MTQGRPIVSVIVITYNQEKYVARTLDAILAQRCDFPFEIVLSDDCSSDSTPAICQAYAERYPDVIRYMQNQANKGVVDNYFDTLRRTRGMYIADCGGDDVWCDPLKLQKEKDLLDANPNAVLVHTDWAYLHEDSGALEDSDPDNLRQRWRKPMLPGMDYFIPMLTRSPNLLVHSCTMMFRRDAFDRCDNPEFFSGRRWLSEDLQLIVALSREGDFAYLPDVTMHYSVAKPSISSAENAAKAYRFYLNALELTRALQQKYQVADQSMEEYYSRAWHYIMALALLSRDKNKISQARELGRSLKVSISLRTRLKLLINRLGGW